MPLNVSKIYPDWGNPVIARHNLRVICDQEGLTFAMKELVSRTVHCESGYSIKATHPNLDAAGRLRSEDYGICQWNDKYHGSEISPYAAMNDPERACRLMARYAKAGQLRQWVCYSSGLYLQYSA